MIDSHPITPPPEMIAKWAASMCGYFEAARWGADQQLEQAANWLDSNAVFSPHLTISPSGDALRQAMRPKSSELKEVWQQISDSCNLSRLEINEILGLIADEVEKRGDKQLDLDPGETSDWLRQQASKALDA